MIDEIINKMDKDIEEDAPGNSVAGGGVDLAPNAAVSQSPHMIKRKKEQGAEQEKIKNKIKKMVQNNEDNNNIIFKQILDGLDKVETKLDEKVYGKTEIKEVEKEDYKSFKDKYVEDVRKMPDGRFGVYADKFKNNVIIIFIILYHLFNFVFDFFLFSALFFFSLYHMW